MRERQQRWMWAVLGLGLAFRDGPAGVANAAVVSIGPTADTFVAAAFPANVYGAAGAFAVSPAGSLKGEMQSLLQFSTSAVKNSFDAQFGAGQWQVDSVSLKLFAAPAIINSIFNNQAPGSFNAQWMQTDSWVEGEGTPNISKSTDLGAPGVSFKTLPSVLSSGDQPLGTFHFADDESSFEEHIFTLAPGLLSDLQSGSPVSLRLFTTNPGMSATYNSRSYFGAGSRPVLTVEASQVVPEPTGIVTLGAAAVLSLSRRTRRR